MVFCAVVKKSFQESVVPFSPITSFLLLRVDSFFMRWFLLRRQGSSEVVVEWCLC